MISFQRDRVIKDPKKFSKKNLQTDVQHAFEGNISLEKNLNGEIIEVSLAPNESKIIAHGLRVIPKYRLILRQTGNAVITDVNDDWTEKTIGLMNNSLTDTVKLTLKLMVG